MINELNHRVKNSLATVQSLALQTFRSPGPDAPAKFDKRLAALADAHDLLTQSSWQPVDIRSVVERCAKAAIDNVVGSGPPAILPAQTAVALCMCLHELLTNAMKYGSLSVAGGQVRITWTRDADGEIDLLWHESGGPPVVQPERQGFGTRLTDRLSRAEMGGEISREYAPDGLRVRLRIAPSDTDRWSNDFR
jgi:two-component sensor histidine kinase